MLATSPLHRLPLPEKGTVGLRKMLNLGNFNQDRQRGLATYLSHLASQIQSLSQVPALSQFLSPAPLGQPLAMPVQGVPVAQPAVAQPIPGTAVVSAPLAPAIQAQQALQQAVAATPVVGVPVASPYAAPVAAQPYPQAYPVQASYPVQATPVPAASGGSKSGGLGMGMLGAGAVAGVLAGVAGAAMMHGSSHSSHQDYCSACEGRGFRHTSNMNHDERWENRCFFCEDCQECRGKGRRYGSPHHHGHHHHHHHHSGLAC